MKSSQKNDDAAVEDFVLAISLVVRRIRAHAPAELREFSWTQKGILSRLDRDGPATIAELARAEGIKPQSMGTAVGALEEMGYVERKPHPTDGRQMNIKLLAKGVALRKDIRDAKQSWLSSAIAKLDKQEKAALFKAAEIMKRLVEM